MAFIKEGEVNPKRRISLYLSASLIKVLEEYFNLRKKLKKDFYKNISVFFEDLIKKGFEQEKKEDGGILIKK